MNNGIRRSTLCTAITVPACVSEKKKILKSSRDPEQQQDLVLCLDDLLSDGTEEPSESEESLTALNRGGLLCVNNMTFELFYFMELEFRRHWSGRY